MSRPVSFGELLRDARERRGIDAATAARRLRIRPDILTAIECSDFSVMPPRGYSRNMVNAYARYVGLDPAEITHMYLDELHAYETGRTRSYVRNDNSYSGAMSDYPSYREPARSRSTAAPASRERLSSGRRGELEAPRGSASYGGGRRVNAGNASSYRSLEGGRSMNSAYGSSRSRSSSGYTQSIYSNSSRSGILEKLPFIIIAIVLVALVAVVLKFVLADRGEVAEEETPNVPISGLTDTSNPVDESLPTVPVVEPEPTYALFEFEVKSGGSSYVEVYMDDKVIVAETISGPMTREFEVTGTMRFVTTGVNSLTAYLDGEPITLEDDDEDGVYIYEVDFADVLAAWEEENAEALAEAAQAQAEAQAAAAKEEAAKNNATSDQE